MHELRTSRRVEFADTDMAGIVHFARFFVFMETAEHDFLRVLGTPVHFDHEGMRIGWPRRDTACRYHSPARMGDVLDIHVRVLRKGRTAITWGFTFTIGERLVAEGHIACVCCALGEGERGLRPVPIPAFLAERIEEAPSESAGELERGETVRNPR